jgi:uncharacterized membrane protein YedE/YeeE
VANSGHERQILLRFALDRMTSVSMTTSRVFLPPSHRPPPRRALVLYGRPEAALIAGVAGLVLHWLLTSKPQHDGEMADASYFFGFLLTLIFLAAGLVPSARRSRRAGRRHRLPERPRRRWC